MDDVSCICASAAGCCPILCCSPRYVRRYGTVGTRSGCHRKVQEKVSILRDLSDVLGTLCLCGPCVWSSWAWAVCRLRGPISLIGNPELAPLLAGLGLV